jgi:hypothetical protein
MMMLNVEVYRDIPSPLSKGLLWLKRDKEIGY